VEVKTVNTLDELPPLGQTDCDLTPEEIAKRSVDRFNQLATAKYMQGQAEHGGCLVNKVCLDHMEEELVDCWHYLQALKIRLGERQ
tara:strand:- start:140 stop:397 length:258 start_codon:yes stop_codon:yes gene_type:complete